MKLKALFLNPVPQPIEIKALFFNNLFTRKKHLVIFSSPSTENMKVLLHAVNNGLQIEVSKVFPFAQSKEAYEYAEQGGYVGKVAIEIN